MTASARTAFFYQQPEVLDREKHKGLRIKLDEARFAAENQSVPLVVAEFREASLEYPIVFARGDDGNWLALALTGLQAGRNAFVDERGKWTANYVPASVRRYPFILAQAADGQHAIAVDLAATHRGAEGELLFDEQGEPGEGTRRVMSLLADFQTQAERTHALGVLLNEQGLLTEQSLQVQLADGRKATVEGAWIVNEIKLNALSDDRVLKLFRDGSLAAIHAHILSLRNLVPLLDRSAPAQDLARVP